MGVCICWLPLSFISPERMYASQQRIIWPQMSSVLRLRNPNLHASRITGHVEVCREEDISLPLRYWQNTTLILPRTLRKQDFHLQAASHSCLCLHIAHPWHKCTMQAAWDALPAARAESLDPWGDFPAVPLSQMGAKLYWPFLGRCQKSPPSSHFSQSCSWSIRWWDCMQLHRGYFPHFL